MLFRFLILSDEADDFKREIKIDSESTFLDLQNAILDSVGYTKDQMTSFFICDDDWSKKTDYLFKVTTATNISAAGSVSLTKVEDEATTVASGSEEIPYRDQTRTLFHYL